MGVAVSKVGSKGLEFTRGNEAILNELLAELEKLALNNPDEAKAVFQLPLSWSTTVASSALPASPGAGRDGRPLLSFSDGLVTVRTLSLLDGVLRAAGAGRVAELKRALEANPDPVAKILGSEYGQGADLLSVVEKAESAAGSDPEAQQLRKRLVLLLASMDAKLLRSSVSFMSQETRLNIAAAEQEVDLLRTMAGPDKDNVLEAISWDSAYKAGNGVRAPPWRQVNGDLGYVAIKPVGQDPFEVMANVSGYWVMKGADEAGKVDYERVGDIFPTLVALLRVKSPHFSDTIDRQEMRYAGPSASSSTDLRASTQRNMAQFLSSAPSQDNSTDGTSDVGNATMRATKRGGSGTAGGKTLRKNGGPPRALQPSEKWAALGMTNNKKEPATKAAASSLPPPSSMVNMQRTMSRASTVSTNMFMTTQVLEKIDDGVPDEPTADPEEEIEERRIKPADLPPEYWNIQRLVKFLGNGNQTAALIALVSFKDYDLTAPMCQYAIKDVGGLEVLINLLDTEHTKCKIGALQILRDASTGVHVRKAIADQDSMGTLVKTMDEADFELKVLRPSHTAPA